jgi:hypothetical protein
MLARANERITSALTGASSLVVLAVAALIGGFGLHEIQAGMATMIAVLAIVGGVVLVLAYRFLHWQRDELYDDVVLHGFRHVHPQAVACRAAQLVSSARRHQCANTLERFVEAASRRHLTPVPLPREALIELKPQVHELSLILRTEDVELEPAGMVLLHRFITHGASSPLFKATAERRDLERELARITRVLGPERRDERLRDAA